MCSLLGSGCIEGALRRQNVFVHQVLLLSSFIRFFMRVIDIGLPIRSHADMRRPETTLLTPKGARAPSTDIFATDGWAFDIRVRYEKVKNDELSSCGYIMPR